MCDFCSKPKVRSSIENESLTSVFTLRIEGNKLVCIYNAYSVDSSFDEEIYISFCPMCGKSLKPETSTV